MREFCRDHQVDFNTQTIKSSKYMCVLLLPPHHLIITKPTVSEDSCRLCGEKVKHILKSLGV